MKIRMGNWFAWFCVILAILMGFAIRHAWSAVELREGTDVTIQLGPFLDKTDGVTVEGSLTITSGDVKLSKNGGVFGGCTDSNAATVDANGWYYKTLDQTDTNTLGELIVMVHDSEACPVWREFSIVTQNWWDSKYSTDLLHVDLQAVDGNETTAAQAEVILGTGYDDWYASFLKFWDGTGLPMNDVFSPDPISGAEIQGEAEDAIRTYKLDHLVYAADSDDPNDNSIVAKLAASDGDWSGYIVASGALEALGVHADTIESDASDAKTAAEKIDTNTELCTLLYGSDTPGATAAALTTVNNYIDTEVASILTQVNEADVNLVTIAGYIDTEVASILTQVNEADVNLVTIDGYLDTEIASILTQVNEADVNLVSILTQVNEADVNLVTVAGYIDTEIASILTQVNEADVNLATIAGYTDDIGVAGAGLTAIGSVGAVAGAVGSVSGAVGSVTADVGIDAGSVDDVWNEASADHVAALSFGSLLKDVNDNAVLIVEDTGTTIPGLISTLSAGALASNNAPTVGTANTVGTQNGAYSGYTLSSDDASSWTITDNEAAPTDVVCQYELGARIPIAVDARMFWNRAPSGTATMTPQAYNYHLAEYESIGATLVDKAADQTYVWVLSSQHYDPCATNLGEVKIRFIASAQHSSDVLSIDKITVRAVPAGFATPSTIWEYKFDHGNNAFDSLGSKLHHLVPEVGLVATADSTTSFTLDSGQTTADAYVDRSLMVRDEDTGYHEVRRIDEWTGGLVVTVESAYSFTPAIGDKWMLMSEISGSTTVAFDELVSNGTFDNWSEDDPDGWTVSLEDGSDPMVNEVGTGEPNGGAGTGYCNIYTSDNSNIYMHQTTAVSVVVGRRYRVSINVDTVTDGSIVVYERVNGQFNSGALSTIGEHTLTFIATDATCQIAIRREIDAGQPVDVTFDDVSVKLCSELIAEEIKTAIEAPGSSLAQILTDTGTDGVVLKAAGLDADAVAEIWATAMYDLAAGAPSITASVKDAINYIYMAWRNETRTVKIGDDAETRIMRDDGSEILCERDLSDDDTTYIQTEYGDED